MRLNEDDYDTQEEINDILSCYLTMASGHPSWTKEIIKTKKYFAKRRSRKLCNIYLNRLLGLRDNFLEDNSCKTK